MKKNKTAPDKKKFLHILLSLFCIAFSACSHPKESNLNNIKSGLMNKTQNNSATGTKEQQKATFGAGCFWCVEAIFKDLNGVINVTSGYSGGEKENPTYKEVCSGSTGHAEVVQITFDPSLISFEELLEVFWQTHDPTSVNRQGHDIGTQYRSAIFYHNQEQKESAEKYKTELNKAGAFSKDIVTEIVPFKNFYPAENYHQDYFDLNADQPYCRAVIQPKVEKFRKVFKNKLKN